MYNPDFIMINSPIQDILKACLYPFKGLYRIESLPDL